MATAKPHSSPPARPHRHRLRNGAIGLVLLVVMVALLCWHRLQAQALAATSYGARIACTCHYGEGRDLKDCRDDFEPGMGLVTLSDDPPKRTIAARVDLLASQSAAFHDGAGCVLQKWMP